MLAQDHVNTRSPYYPYTRCVTAIQKTPQNAYVPCKQYLDEFPSEDVRRVEYVKTWTVRYEKALPYIRFLQGLPDQNAPWFVYVPDMNIDLPQTTENEGRYKTEISRSFGNAFEEMLLRRAEAVYSSPSKMVEHVFRHLGGWEQQNSGEMAPLWGRLGNDHIQVADVITARAVRYYYDLTEAARRDPHLSTGFTAEAIYLQYRAGIKHFDKFVHDTDQFEDVYVADLALKWSFNCGMLCGIGFTRSKLVVLDSDGNVKAMYFEAPGYWVS